MFISARKKYKAVLLLLAAGALCAAFLVATDGYRDADFGKTFGSKAYKAQEQLQDMQPLFETCATICGTDSRFMQAIVFPELMRYNSLKDGIEAESLRTLYVQFGKEYANFSIGIFQMKPGFAETIEQKITMLPDSMQQELALSYDTGEATLVRMQRVERLLDKEWQLIYLTAFICICNETYKEKLFASALEKMQWYATVYNAGFDRSDAYISRKIKEENFYLQQQMPGKKFKYAAIAGWYFSL